MATVEWALVYGDGLLSAPGIRAFGGSFDGDAARETTAAYADPDDDAEALGSVDEYEILAYDEDQHGLYRDGEAVSVDNATTEEVRGLVAEREESLANLDDSIQQLIDRIGLESSASLTFGPAEDGGFIGNGYGYAVDGNTTTTRWVSLNGDESLNELQAAGDDIDALSAVTVGEDGPVRWVEGTIDTDRTSLDGYLFHIGEAPFDPES